MSLLQSCYFSVKLDRAVAWVLLLSLRPGQFARSSNPGTIRHHQSPSATKGAVIVRRSRTPLPEGRTQHEVRLHREASGDLARGMAIRCAGGFGVELPHLAEPLAQRQIPQR